MENAAPDVEIRDDSGTLFDGMARATCCRRLLQIEAADISEMDHANIKYLVKLPGIGFIAPSGGS